MKVLGVNFFLKHSVDWHMVVVVGGNVLLHVKGRGIVRGLVLRLGTGTHFVRIRNAG